jgi:hypothetical protein
MTTEATRTDLGPPEGVTHRRDGGQVGGGDPDGAEIALSELRVSDGAQHRSAVRWALFVFHAVRDVLPAGDPDRLLVVHRGPPDPDAWVDILISAGFAASSRTASKSATGPEPQEATDPSNEERH